VQGDHLFLSGEVGRGGGLCTPLFSDQKGAGEERDSPGKSKGVIACGGGIRRVSSAENVFDFMHVRAEAEGYPQAEKIYRADGLGEEPCVSV